MLEIVRRWGADFVVSRGRKIYPAEIEGFYAVDATDRRIGLVTYEISGDQCEIVTLDAFDRFAGAGTALLEAVCEHVAEHGVRRMWLITTNDNMDAIRFYQRRGWTIAAVHVKAIERSRKIYPLIPPIGNYGIEIRDGVEFQKMV